MYISCNILHLVLKVESQYSTKSQESIVNEWKFTASTDLSTLYILTEDLIEIRTKSDNFSKPQFTIKSTILSLILVPYDESITSAHIISSPNGFYCAHVSSEGILYYISLHTQKCYKKIDLNTFQEKINIQSIFLTNHGELYFLIAGRIFRIDKNFDFFVVTFEKFAKSIISCTFTEKLIFILSLSEKQYVIDKFEIGDTQFTQVPKSGSGYVQAPSIVIKVLSSPKSTYFGILETTNLLHVLSTTSNQSIAQFSNICDFSWFGDDQIVISTEKNISIVQVTKNQNMLETPHVMLGASKISNCNQGEFLALECEISEKIQVNDENVLWGMMSLLCNFITNPVKRYDFSLLYQLIHFVEEQPLSIIKKKLIAGNVTEAYEIATKFEIDSDLVLQERWKLSKKDSQAISDILSKIKNQEWVIREAIECNVALDLKKNILEFAKKISNEPQEIQELLDKLSLFCQMDIPDPKEFVTFSKTSLLDSAKRFAEERKIELVQLLLENNPFLDSHRLEILDCIPLTISPTKWSNLIKFDQSNANWFKKKAMEYESQVGLVDYSLEILQLAVHHGITSLQEILTDFKAINDLLYEDNLPINSTHFSSLHTMEKISLLLHLKKETPILELDRIKTYMDSEPNLWKSVFLTLAKINFSSTCSMIRENALLLPNLNILVEIVLEIAYLANAGPHSEEVFNLCEMIPEDVKMDKKTREELNLLQTRLDVLRKLVEYDIILPLTQFASYQSSFEQTKFLIQQILSYCIKHKFIEKKFKQVEKDLLEIQNLKIFAHWSEKYVITNLVLAALDCLHFDFVSNHLKDQNLDLLGLDLALYVHTQRFINQGTLDLAQKCFKIHLEMNLKHLDKIKTQKWKFEEVLIQILNMLNKFEHVKSPVQIRQEKNHIITLIYILDKNEEAYLEYDLIKRFCNLVDLKNYQNLIVDAAIKVFDYEFANLIVKELLDEHNSLGYESIIKMVQNEAVPLKNRKELVRKGLETCPLEYIDTLCRLDQRLVTPSLRNPLEIEPQKLFIKTHPFYSNLMDMQNHRIQLPEKTHIESLEKQYLHLYDVQVIFAQMNDKACLLLQETVESGDPQSSFSAATLLTWYYAIQTLQEVKIDVFKETINEIVDKALLVDSPSAQLVQKYHHQTSSTSHTNQLAKYLPHVDVGRFNKDKEYKRSQVCKLVETIDDAQFEFGLVVNQNVVEPFELYQIHVKKVLESKEVNKNKVFKIVQEHLMDHKVSTCEILKEATNHVEVIVELWGLYEPHVKNLASVLHLKNLDVKALLVASNFQNIIDLIDPHLNFTNTEAFFKALGSYPVQPNVTISNLTLHVFKKQILSEKVSIKDKMEDIEDYITRITDENQVLDLITVISSLKSLSNRVMLMQALLEHWKAPGHEKFIQLITKRLFKMKIASQLFLNESCEKCEIIWDHLVEDMIELEDALYSAVIILHDESIVEEVLTTFKQDAQNMSFSSKFSKFEVLDCYLNAYDLMMTWIEKCDKMTSIKDLEMDEIAEWPPSPSHSLEFLNLSLKSIDFIDNKIKLAIEKKIKDYINNETKPLVARVNISRVASKHIKLDSKILSGFYISQTIKEIWKNEAFDGFLMDAKNSDKFSSEFSQLVQNSDREEQFMALVEIVRMTNSTLANMIIDRLMGLGMWKFLFLILHQNRSFVSDEKVEMNIFESFIGQSMVNEAYVIALTSKSLSHHVLEHYKQHFEHRLSQEVMIGMIRCGFVKEVIKFEGFLEVLFDESICILGSEIGDAECQLITELALNDNLEIALGYVALKVYCVPDIYMNAPCKMLMLKDYLKHQADLLSEDSERVKFCKKLCQDALKFVQNK